jgi:hypothetical protein
MNIVPDYRLDMTGEPCPYPAVATLEALPQLKKAKFWRSSATARSQSITSCRCAKPWLYGAGHPAGWANDSLYDSEIGKCGQGMAHRKR